MVSLTPSGRLPTVLAAWLMMTAACCPADSTSPLVTVMLNNEDGSSTVISGRVVTKAQDGGILLEERNGTLHNLTPDDFSELHQTEDPFVPMNAEQLSADLVNELGPAFGMKQTDHFVIASAASAAWTEHCAQLLETVYTEYFEFFEDLQVDLAPADRPLAVVLFRHPQDLQKHARQQHPETSFEDVPGYYSSRFNRMYATDISTISVRSRRDLLRLLRKNPRHTETIVHETVHLLGYNTGLHVRQADNPLWFTEGLATYFEPVSGRGRVLWNGPGRVNAFHLRRLKAGGPKNRFPIPLAQLVQDNRAFQDAASAADAYASAWALVYGLLRRHEDAFAEITRGMQQRRPLIEVTAADELKLITDATELPPDQLETRAASTVRRLRVPSR